LTIVDKYVEPGRSALEMSKRTAFQRMLIRIRDTDGRDIRTIIVDPERAPLVQLGFELFAVGNLTLDQLSKRLHQRGLPTRATSRYPAQQVSFSKLARMLRDRYYLGYITYHGEELPGRHEPLVDPHLLDRVQAVLDARGTSGERRRVHHHYLKGTLYCGHCHQADNSGRMIIQHTVTRRRDEYTYFFCRNRQQGNCPAAYANIAAAEYAVERYYTTVSQQRITDVLATLSGATPPTIPLIEPATRSRSPEAAPTTNADYSIARSFAGSTSPTTASPTTNWGRRRPDLNNTSRSGPHRAGLKYENRPSTGKTPLLVCDQEGHSTKKPQVRTTKTNLRWS
jgi:hypothetical protein